MRIFTVKGVCTEVPKVELNRKQVAGLTVLATKELQPLKVVYATEIPFFGSFVNVEPGDHILVAAEFLTAQRWSKDVYTYDGQQFVVVPYDVILGTLPTEQHELIPTPEPAVENP